MSDTSLKSVLIVDDEPAVRDIMARWARSLGLDASTASDADEALEALRDDPRDLAVIDVMMPGHDVANELHRDHPHTAVVLATAHVSRVEEAPSAVIADLLIKPFARDRFLLAVDRSRQWKKETLEEQRWNNALARELRERIDAIARAPSCGATWTRGPTSLRQRARCGRLRRRSSPLTNGSEAGGIRTISRERRFP